MMRESGHENKMRIAVQNDHQEAAVVAQILLPDRVQLADFGPVAYFDRHMDCIRVFIADRSVTEDRIDDTLTLYMTNHASPFDPIHCGFCLKGIRHLLDSLGIEQGMEIRLAALIDAIVKHSPHSTVARILEAFPRQEGLVVEWDERIAA
jgi:hypothetical protein